MKRFAKLKRSMPSGNAAKMWVATMQNKRATP